MLQKYPATDFTIVAFPCNQFGGQEPGSNAEVKAFAAARGFVGKGALLMDKVDVNGPNMSPVYQYLKVASGDTSDIGWNFGKFLVRPDGTVFGRYAPTTSPLGLDKFVAEMLAERTK
ncbi:Glutathione peroxidase 1, mitochondrial [Tetrabaena socialis]|uniref:Glutathione peroxidase n=1 Tax=Tetrabaena socialis TaxID=47790 RepID=A0A2J8A427_9CHLO|nr:Glutathione peroxidase 1, mitochondrial [Tetrabaena socialis]|eukprot:PNH07269.1 Glutathione peroxidase 1, mitochondrial [Tetrabaena socialis]